MVWLQIAWFPYQGQGNQLIQFNTFSCSWLIGKTRLLKCWVIRTRFNAEKAVLDNISSCSNRYLKNLAVAMAVASWQWSTRPRNYYLILSLLFLILPIILFKVTQSMTRRDGPQEGPKGAPGTPPPLPFFQPKKIIFRPLF